MKKEYINYNKIDNLNYEIIFENGIKMRNLLREIDGYFVWYPSEEKMCGFLSSWILRNLADKMDKLNKK